MDPTLYFASDLFWFLIWTWTNSRLIYTSVQTYMKITFQLHFVYCLVLMQTNKLDLTLKLSWVNLRPLIELQIYPQLSSAFFKLQTLVRLFISPPSNPN